MKAAIYCRESTEKQEIETLVSMCIKEAEKLGIKNYKIFQDVESGYSNKRSEYLKMLEEIKKGNIDTLILYESSRLTRDELEHQLVYKLFKEKGVRVYTVNHGWLDLHNEDDMFLTSLLNLLDAREGRKTAKRVKDRLGELANSGRWIGGRPPLGYRLEDKKLVIVEDEAMDVLNMYKMFLGGHSRTDIARLYGLDPKRVRRILKNPMYTGKIYYKKEILFEGEHDAIISKELFQLVQDKLSTINREVTNEIYTLKDLIYCTCGKKLYRSLRVDGVYSYKCTCEDRTHCVKKDYREDVLISFVLDELEHVIDSIEFSDDVDKKQELKKQIADYKRLQRQCNNKEEMLTKNLLNNFISQEVFEKLITENKNNKEFYTNKLKTLDNILNNEAARKKSSELIKRHFKKIKNEQDPEKINRFLKIIIDRIEFVNDFRLYIRLRL